MRPGSPAPPHLRDDQVCVVRSCEGSHHRHADGRGLVRGDHVIEDAAGVGRRSRIESASSSFRDLQGGRGVGIDLHSNLAIEEINTLQVDLNHPMPGMVLRRLYFEHQFLPRIVPVSDRGNTIQVDRNHPSDLR